MKPKTKLVALFIAVLIISMPVCFANELSLTYDSNGNLVTGDGKFRVYNSLNQLWKVYNGSDSSGLLLEELTYHPVEERVLVKKVYDSSGLKETVYYLDDNFVRVINSSGTFDFTYVQHEGQLVAQQNPDRSKLFVHGDHLGSTNVVTNEAGDVVENTMYSPFGEVLTGGSATRYGYEAKEHDSVLGDTDFHFRRYNPEWALFTQPDTLIQNVYDPQSLNRYAFERNNPYRFVDADGHVYWDKLALAVFSGIASLGLATGGIGLSILGVPTSVAPPVGAAAIAGGVATACLGFANFGDAFLDSIAALQEDEEYFENDAGGILANLGGLIGGKKGAGIGRTAEAVISGTDLIKNIPRSGEQIGKYYNSIVSAIDTSATLMNLINNANLNSEVHSSQSKSSNSHGSNGGSGGTITRWSGWGTYHGQKVIVRKYYRLSDG